ncbi:MAG TPA: glycosyltransferase family 39 protein, partial [Anaerolineales bacterium]|nr:glycosyltransferase family 39 protein [Anaerolineales bacterium]
MLNRLVNRLETAVHLRSSRRAKTVGFLLIVISFLASLTALNFFATELPAPGWTPYIVSVVLFMVAGYVLFRNPSVALTPPRLNVPVLIGLGIILLIAAGLRYYDLQDLPYGTWWDEADISTVARNILLDPEYRPVFVVSNDHPLHFFLVAAFFFKFLGVSTWALRVVTATYGVLTVIPAFLLGRELYGNRFGLIFAFLFAVARWHITFSRFAIYSVTLPLFELLALWLLLRAKRTNRVQDFAWAGFAIGLGLNFHISFRLFPIVVLVFVAWWAVSFWRKQTSEPNRGVTLAVNFSALALATTLTFAPVIQFALQHPDVYWGRSGTVSIFVQRDEPSLTKALWSNTSKHLLMFNYRGDRNGRHNLPGAPMLDPFTGALFVVGAILALSRLRHMPNILFILIFSLGLSAGILTLDFEAPQGSRAIGALTAVLYFAALVLETLWRAIDSAEMSRAMRQLLNTAIALGLGSAIFYSNAYTYFVTQANDDTVWREHNGVETLTARKMLEVGPANTTIYASVFLHNHLIIQFLAPEVTDSRAIIPPIGLPVREPGDKPVAIFVDESNTWIVDEARRLYPNARFDTYPRPSGSPVLQRIYLNPEDVQSVQGLTAKYWL